MALPESKRSVLRMSWTFLVAVLAFRALSCSGAAQLLTDVSFSREVVAGDRTTGARRSSGVFSGSTLPAFDSFTIDGFYGGSLSALYTFSGDGDSASFSIITDYSANTYDGVFEQGVYGREPITFRTTRPVSYTISASLAGQLDKDGHIVGVADMELSVGGRVVAGRDMLTLNSRTDASGIIPKDTIVSLIAASGGFVYIDPQLSTGEPTSGHAEIVLELTAIPNTPPKLPSIGDTTVVVGSILAFNVGATDDDVPANQLAYSLDAGAPYGSSIDLGGTFVWTPSEAQAMATYQITVRVTDDGVPPLSASQSFRVTVCRRDANGDVICPAEPQQTHKNDGQKDDPSNCCQGDPIDIGSGNMFDKVTDFRTAGEHSLQFVRYYNSLAATNVQAVSLGQRWRSTFDRFLIITVSAEGMPLAVAERANGQILTFRAIAGGWGSDSDVDVRLTTTDSGWQLTDGDDTIELYRTNDSGHLRLTAIRSRGGYTQSLEYDTQNRLSFVTDSFGRTLQFDYQGSLLASMTVPGGLVASYDYTASGQSGEMLDRLAAATYSTSPQTSNSYLYEASGLPFALTAVIDESGSRFTSWTYDSQGRATSSQRAGGAERATIGYEDADGSRWVTNALGGVEFYRFIVRESVPKVAEIHRIETANVSAAVSLHSYDSNGFLASATDWNGNLTKYINDGRGQPTNITQAAGTPQERVTVITYDPVFHLPLRIVAPRATTDLAYDDAGNLLTRTETDASTNEAPYSTSGLTRVWTFTYNDVGQVLTVTRPRRDVTATTRNIYDASGNLATVTDPLGHVTQFLAYDARGLLRAMIDPNGVTNRFGYDLRGRLLTQEVLAALGNALTAFSYDVLGQMTSVTLPDGSKLGYHYDPAHRLQSVSNALGESITFVRDGNGNVIEQNVRAADGSLARIQRHVFDPIDRLLRAIGAASQTNSFGYDADGNRLSTKDGLGNTTKQAFDGLNRLMATFDPLNIPTQFGYDEQDNLSSVADPRSLVTRYIQDGFGQTIQESSPDRGRTVYTLDEAGNRVSQVDARGVVTQRSFDALNRLTAESFPSSPQEDITYRYDDTNGGNRGIGRLTGFSDETGSTALSYNERGDLASTTRTIGNITYGTAYTYDIADRVTGVTYPSGHIITYGRDSLGRVNSVAFRSSASAAPVVLASDISYRPFGPVAGFTYGNGLIRRSVYDLDYRLVGIDTSSSNTNIQALGLAYDAANNITAISDLLDSARSQSFDYDVNYRLTNAAGVYGSVSYGYDGVGNRVLQVAGGKSNRFIYPPDANRLESIQGSGGIRALTYSATGNIENDDRGAAGVFGYGYGSRNRLSALTVGGQVVATYRYNALGQRLVKAIGTNVTHFHYDQQSHLIGESDGTTGAMLREYVWLDDMPLAQIESDGTAYFIHCDHLNTPQKLTDATQAVVWQRDQLPFGEPLYTVLTQAGFDGQGQFEFSVSGNTGISYVVQVSTNLGGGNWASLSTNAAPFVFADSGAGNSETKFYRVVEMRSVGSHSVTHNLRFPGQYYDVESGLNYNLMRDYDPSLGRYIEADPIGLEGGTSVFGYVDGNPLTRADDTGLISWDWNDVEISALQAWAGFSDSVTFGVSSWARKELGTDYADPCLTSYRVGEWAPYALGGAKLLTVGIKAARRFVTKETTTVIGRVPDLQELGTGEKSLLDRLTPNLGSPKANWQRNSGVIRQEMNRGLPIRDASVGDTSGQFLNAERNLLRDRGWNFDANTGYWMPQAK
ncbi:MAG: hypothetical protein HY299_02640 [Verrucomicrobia bacterium]|nr:hypothetical protein [Verrucomicrobiota bacterium]